MSDKTRGIDFATLSLRDALDLAVLIEEEALERYEELMDQLEQHRTPAAARFFRSMARQEAKHAAKLAQRRRRLFGEEKCTVTRAMIFDIEAPDYDSVRAFMTPREALDTALWAERKAGAFFAAAVPFVTDPEVRALFEELRQEETEHERLVLAEIDKLPPETKADPDDYGDEPVGM
jgi:rubrerythrin